MLKNKDGTPYKLAHPNPVMTSQTLWDEFKIHNMKWTSEKDEIKQEIIEKPLSFTSKETFISALDEAKAEEPFQRDVVHEDLQRKEEIEEENGLEKVFIHLLPAIIREKKDSLYGETYKTIQYEKPTSFEGIVLEEADLEIKIWTEISVSLGSIIYPRLGSKRWWKIQTKDEIEGGWVLIGVPSSHQPSFS